MQRADEMPDMITIHSAGVARRWRGASRGDRRGEEGPRGVKVRGEGEKGGGGKGRKKDGVRRSEVAGCLSSRAIIMI